MKTYVFDIDGTICSLTEDKTYQDVKPIKDRINYINSLADKGNRIIFYTARGMGRHQNDVKQAQQSFYDLTVDQLKKWNVRYDQLFFGKPAGDIYVDDKSENDIQFFTHKKS